jgi:prepilin-type N-terminal cleavage/methylation domain-containing protein
MSKDGFTLLEVLIVLAIVGLLVWMVALGVQDVARVAIGG